MNILELQDTLKNFSQQQLVKEMQRPSGQVPQYLILTELDRRKRMEADMQAQMAKGQPTVAEEVVAAAGVPQEGIMQAARAMAPESSIEQNTGIKQMAEGGVVKANEAGFMSNLMNTRGIMGTRLGDKFPFNAFGYGSGEQFSDNPDAFKTVSPFPARDPSPRKRSEWMAKYGDTHNKDGSPKFDAPIDAMQGGIGALSANAEDYQAPNIAMQTQSKRAAAAPIDRPVNRTASGMPSVPSAEGFNAISPAPVFDATQDLGSGTNTGLENVVQRNDDLGDFGTGDKSVPRAGGPLAVGSLAQGMIDATGNIPNTMPPTLDTGTEGLGNLENIIDDIVQTEQEEEAGSLSEALSKRPGFRTSPGDTIEGVFSGKTPNQKANEFIEYFNSLKTPDDENPMVNLVESGIDKLTAPEVRSPDDAVETVRRQAANTLSGDNFTNDPNQGWSFPTDTDPSFASTGTSPETDAMNVLNVLPALTESSSGEELVEKATERMTDRRLEALLGDGDDEVSSRGVVIEDTDVDKIASTSDDPETIEDFVEQEKLREEPKTTKGDEDGSGGGNKGGRSGGMSSIESEIAQLLKDREREADKDKWLALAKMGMALMSSKSPTLGGALGEAGIKGMEDLQKSRAQYKKDKLGLLGLKQRAEQARMTNQRLADAANRKVAPKPRTAAEVNAALDYFQDVAKQQALVPNELGGDPTYDYSRVSEDVQKMIKQLEDQYRTMLQSPVDLTGS